MVYDKICPINIYQKSITVYEFADGFYVEVNKSESCTEFYIAHKNYGIKDFAFGICDLREGDEEVIIMNNLEQMISVYKEQYFNCTDIED